MTEKIFPRAWEARRRSRFRTKLLRWYDANARALPWRGTRHPYRIWVSEIMLQQTRVAVVRERYPEFLRRFPDLRALARARQASVLAAWSGLGYYRRARALRQAARIVVRDHRGRMPRTAQGLRELPGIGRYTAAAIASIAFGEPEAVVDGNVERVLRRLTAGAPQSRELDWRRAAGLLGRSRPGDFNQAMMELGATVCLPARPLCGSCPVAGFCAARTRRKTEARARTLRRKERLRYRLMLRRHAVYLVRRPSTAGVMGGMWELPPAKSARSGARITLRHSIMNTDYRVTVFVVRNPTESAGSGRWFRYGTLARLPLTGLARKVLRRAGALV